MRLLLRLFYRLLYYEFAGMYDLVSWSVSFGQWKKWVFTTLDHLGTGNTLELGIGPGHLQKQLAERSYDVFGMDLSPRMTRIARRRMLNSGLLPNLIQANNLAIPFKLDSFDQVVSTFPTAVIFQSNTIAEIARVLKPGGKLLILPMVYITGNNLAHKLLNWIYRITGQSLPMDKIEDGALTKYFESHGFKSDQKYIEFDDYTLLIIEALLDE